MSDNSLCLICQNIIYLDNKNRWRHNQWDEHQAIPKIQSGDLVE